MQQAARRAEKHFPLGDENVIENGRRPRTSHTGQAAGSRVVGAPSPARLSELCHGVSLSWPVTQPETICSRCDTPPQALQCRMTRSEAVIVIVRMLSQLGTFPCATRGEAAIALFPRRAAIIVASSGAKTPRLLGLIR